MERLDEAIKRVTTLNEKNDEYATCAAVFSTVTDEQFNSLFSKYATKYFEKEELQEITNKWKPYRSIGVWYLWQSINNG